MKKILSTLAVLFFLSAVSCSETENSSVVQNDFSHTEEKPSDSKSSVIQNNSSDKDEDITITIANVDFDCFGDSLQKFNDADNGCKINVVHFSGSYDSEGNPVGLTIENAERGDLDMIKDILTDNAIDVYCSASFFNQGYYEILQRKGAFADLYQFMENDEEVNRNTLNQHVLSLVEKEGKLYSIPAYYTIHTLMGESRYVGTEENWSVDDFISHWEKMPEDSTILGTRGAETVFHEVLRSNLDYFVDYGNAKVNFDTPEFRNLLEFCGRFPSQKGQKAYYNYDAPCFLSSFFMTGFMDCCDRVLTSGEMTMVGYPTFDGKGSYFSGNGVDFSINANSSPEKQQAAWKFIRSFLTEEAQIANVTSFREFEEFPEYSYWADEIGFCINENAFEKFGHGVMNGEYYSDTYMNEDGEHTLELPKQADFDRLKEYINSISRWETGFNHALDDIARTEVEAYLAGEQSLDDTVKFIQNRASIWVSEQS